AIGRRAPESVAHVSGTRWVYGDAAALSFSAAQRRDAGAATVMQWWAIALPPRVIERKNRAVAVIADVALSAVVDAVEQPERAELLHHRIVDLAPASGIVGRLGCVPEDGLEPG